MFDCSFHRTYASKLAYELIPFRWPVWVGPLVVKELKRIIESSEITK